MMSDRLGKDVKVLNILLLFYIPSKENKIYHMVDWVLNTDKKEPSINNKNLVFMWPWWDSSSKHEQW